MPFQNTLEGLFNKGKAKLDQFTNSHSSQSQPQYQPQYQQQQYQPYPQPYPGQYGQPQNQPQYNQPPYQPGHYGQPPNQPQPQYQHQPPYQAQNTPPIPNATRPGPPALPTATKPSSFNTNSSTYWQAAFHSQTPISQVFQQETGAHGWGNNESQNYTSDTSNCFFTPDNKLILRAISRPSASENKYTSARLISHQKLDRQRGCLSATLTAPCAGGIWPAFWLLPSQPFTWPNDGEIDIFESWNGDCVNHSCLHWGHFNGEDWNKHRVIETPIPDLAHAAHVFELAWEQPDDGNGGKLVWYIDGRAIMKASIPAGTRRIGDWKVILNVAMGGNVCGGRLPEEGSYDFVVHELKMSDSPPGGWGRFAGDWEAAREGKSM